MFCVCVCEREKERERKRVCCFVCFVHTNVVCAFVVGGGGLWLGDSDLIVACLVCLLSGRVTHMRARVVWREGGLMGFVI